MRSDQALALVLDPSLILKAQGLEADAWQRELLFSQDRYLLLNCARQTGKSTTVAALALYEALLHRGALVLLVAPVERQSQELFRKVVRGFQALGEPLPASRCNQDQLELANGSRIVALPGLERTIRSFSGVRLIVMDEAARVPDELYWSVRPMLAISRGRLVALSTPFGQRGWFYQEWIGEGPWKRLQITWKDCQRISASFIAEETRAMGQGWVDQEYGCLFTSLEGLVYPEFSRACVPQQALPEGRAVGGIDFGWRNPFAALWGILDRDDVLWLARERYLRQTPLFEHAAALPRHVLWYADPAGRTEIEELKARDLKVRRGDNQLRFGIAAVNARIRSNGLKVLPACVNLLAEARLYRYPGISERDFLGENPIDAHNHALAALRYLVASLDRGRREKRASLPAPAPASSSLIGKRWHQEHLWTRIF